jgi:hypothetical protein
MRRIRFRWLLLALLVVILLGMPALVMVVTYSSRGRVNQANLDLILAGMSEEDVNKILGEPRLPVPIPAPDAQIWSGVAQYTDDDGSWLIPGNSIFVDFLGEPTDSGLHVTAKRIERPTVGEVGERFVHCVKKRFGF